MSPTQSNDPEQLTNHFLLLKHVFKACLSLKILGGHGKMKWKSLSQIVLAFPSAGSVPGTQ